MSKLIELTRLGHSIWLDFIRRSHTVGGTLENLINSGVRGVTSNPSIFELAIAKSTDYEQDLDTMAAAGLSAEEIYEALVLEDIRNAADVLLPVYEQTKGVDGYVSLEVSPKLAHETDATVKEAHRLFATLNRPNVMIKIPATPEGIPAIQEAVSQGINVNVTLIFSLSHYFAAANAYIQGLLKLAANGGNAAQVASVASLFVSRIDTAIDKELLALGDTDLAGKIAIANSKIAYARFKKIFSSKQWKTLAVQGGRVQRPLWASTGTKNPSYPDTLYVDNLIGPDTVNTLPPATLEAFIDHGKVALTLESELSQAQEQIDRLAALGIDLESITQRLQNDGVTAFEKSFDSLMSTIAAKRHNILARRLTLTAKLGGNRSGIDKALAETSDNLVINRIWEKDHTVWKHQPDEISNRLGWLYTAEEMAQNLGRLNKFVGQVQTEGFKHVLLLGMGGSSLAPEVLSKTIGASEGYPDLHILDSTDPGAVLGYIKKLNLMKTLFIVSSKSGGTVETHSLYKYFYNRMLETLDGEPAGKHFVAITDPGSKLADIAEKNNFREVFLNNPDIGGRYSALSFFGLVPAALAGIDVALLLDRAMIMAANNRASSGSLLEINSADHKTETTNLGANLGVIIGEFARLGRDKLTFIFSPAICEFGNWVEQLIAESTGKEGVGILPVVGEIVGEPQEYGDDRLFVYLRLADDHTHDKAVQAFVHTGHPVVTLELNDLYDLGGQFFLWEMATAVASHRLSVNPFDQPDVESAKALARKMVEDYKHKGEIPGPQPSIRFAGLSAYSDLRAATLQDLWDAFLAQSQPGAYIAIQAYITPGSDTDAALLELKFKLRMKTRLAVTTGYGPRFLHSTGQLHKGDSGFGLFIQITSDDPVDLSIPDDAGEKASTISFGRLKASQAAGDRQALINAGRKVIRFHIEEELLTGLALLAQSLPAGKV